MPKKYRRKRQILAHYPLCGICMSKIFFYSENPYLSANKKQGWHSFHSFFSCCQFFFWQEMLIVALRCCDLLFEFDPPVKCQPSNVAIYSFEKITKKKSVSFPEDFAFVWAGNERKEEVSLLLPRVSRIHIEIIHGKGLKRRRECTQFCFWFSFLRIHYERVSPFSFFFTNETD